MFGCCASHWSLAQLDNHLWLAMYLLKDNKALYIMLMLLLILCTRLGINQILIHNNLVSTTSTTPLKTFFIHLMFNVKVYCLLSSIIQYNINRLSIKVTNSQQINKPHHWQFYYRCVYPNEISSNRARTADYYFFLFINWIFVNKYWQEFHSSIQ